MRLILGDCLEKLKELPDNSVDSIVTDPPYGLGFMNKEWDSPEKLKKNLEHHKQKTEDRGKASFSPLPFERYGGKKEGQWFQEWCEEWGRECLRVLKPGGHMLSFSAPRMYHRMTTGLEDAGFQIRDQIMWVFGSGFPKSHNIGKAVDKLLGNEREVLGTKAEFSLDGAKRNPNNHREIGEAGKEIQHEYGYKQGWDAPVTKGQSEWEGWGTALKPAHEPIVVARKPLSESTVVKNIIKWGTGGLNIDVSRVGTDGGCKRSHQQNEWPLNENGTQDRTQIAFGKTNHTKIDINEGRWPANIILDEEAGQILDQQSGECGNGWKKNYGKEDYNGLQYSSSTQQCVFGGGYNGKNTYNDKGGASRFFYCPKTSKKDRNEGLKSYIELFTSTIKIVYYTKDNLWEIEDQKTKLVDMDTSLQKVIEEYGVLLKNDLRWNTGSYGNYIMDQLKKDLIFTTEMETNSIMILETLNLLIEKNTRIYIQELLGEMVKDIKFVKDVEQKNTTLNITIQNKDGYWQNVNLVELNEVWNINTVQGKSSHPTVKPTSLMEYLIKLVTPVGGIVLDPFMGSGSTGKGAVRNGFDFIGIEREEEYMKISEARIKNELDGDRH